MAEPWAPRILSDTWYGRAIGADVAGGTATAAQRWLTTLRMCLRSGDYDIVLTSQGTRRISGLVLLGAFLALTGRRKLVLTEFMPGIRRPGLKGAAATLLYRLVLNRSVLSAQVMTAWERDAYATRYRIDPERLVHIPFYWFDDRWAVEPTATARRTTVMASGRNSCDWTTFFGAVSSISEPVTVVCTARDEETVRRLAPARARVEVELPREAHNSLVADSELFVLSLADTGKSMGHVRFAVAATAGTPVLASAVRGIQGYEHLAVELVEPGDPASLAGTLRRLLADPVELARRAAAVRLRAMERPYSLYVAEMHSFVLGSLPVPVGGIR